MMTNATLDNLTTAKAALILTHNGNIPSKIAKAMRRITEEHAVIEVAIINVYDDEHAMEQLDVSDLAPTVIVFQTGEEVGRTFRPKAKDLYAYADFLSGNGPKPNDQPLVHRPKADRPEPLHLTQRNFKETVLKSSVPVLVDLWAPWCGPCHTIAPAIQELASEMDGKAKVGKVNVDENPALSQQFGVMSIPTLLIFNNGEVVDRMVGALPAFEIKRRLNAWVPSVPE